jgi:hypothetical protein
MPAPSKMHPAPMAVSKVLLCVVIVVLCEM